MFLTDLPEKYSIKKRYCDDFLAAAAVPVLMLCRLLVSNTSELAFLLGVLAFTAALALRHLLKGSGNKYFCANLLIFTLLGISSLIWNFSFWAYCDSTKFSSDIFRGAFLTFQAPLYGYLRARPILKYAWPMLLACVLFIFFLISRFKDLRGSSTFYFGIFFLLVLILSFSYSGGLSRILGYCSGYKEFSENLTNFKDISEILRNYTKLMPGWGLHSGNGHYPPGNLILFKLEQMYMPYLTKLFVLLCCLLTPVPMRYSIKKAGFSNLEANMWSLIFAMCAPVLIFPSIALMPISMCLATVAFAPFVAAVEGENRLMAACLGFSLALMTMFSFVSSMTIFFFMIFALLLVRERHITARKMIGNAAIAGSTLICSFVLLYYLSDFNILTCLKNATAHNKMTMSPTAFDNGYRYLFRSFGNIIPFLMVIGSPILTLFTFALSRRRGGIFLHSLSIALIISVLFASFSGLFYMETERIWLFFIPPILAVAAIEAASLYKEGEYFTVGGLFILNLILSAAQELLIDHSLGTCP